MTFCRQIKNKFSNVSTQSGDKEVGNPDTEQLKYLIRFAIHVLAILIEIKLL